MDGITSSEYSIRASRTIFIPGYGEEYHQLRGFGGPNNLVGIKIGRDALIEYLEDVSFNAYINGDSFDGRELLGDGVRHGGDSEDGGDKGDKGDGGDDGGGRDNFIGDLGDLLSFPALQCNVCVKFRVKIVSRLVEVIKRNGKQIQQVVKFWVEQYEKDSKLVVVELFTMLFEVCGAKYHIQGEFLDKINKRLSKTREKITMIEDMMRKIFTGHYLFSISSSACALRSMLVEWLQIHVLYLKYLGWTLNVKHSIYFNNLVSPLSNPESVIRYRRRNLSEPSLLVDFEEINMNNNNVQGPPPAGPIPQNHGPQGLNLQNPAPDL
ncbi:sister-chromatid cohesion protein 3 [Tanacetum coccineum]